MCQYVSVGDCLRHILVSIVRRYSSSITPTDFSVAITSANLKIVVINSSFGADALVLVY